MKNEKSDRSGNSHSRVRKGTSIVKKPQSGRALHTKSLAKSIADKAKALLKRSPPKEKATAARVVTSQPSTSEPAVLFEDPRRSILDVVWGKGHSMPMLPFQIWEVLKKLYPSFPMEKLDSLLSSMEQTGLLERRRRVGGYVCTKNGEAFLRGEIVSSHEGDADLNAASVVTAGLDDNAVQQDQPPV